MERLVQIFFEAVELKGDGTPAAELLAARGDVADAALQRGLEHMENLFQSEDASEIGFTADDLAGTYREIGVGLESRPGLTNAAIRLYEAALSHHCEIDWEHCVLLQHVGTACVKAKRFADAERWLTECASHVQEQEGHPKDMTLFGGTLSSRFTRREFAAMIHKLLTATYHSMGDKQRAAEHLEKFKAMSAAFSGDVVTTPAAQTNGSKPAPRQFSLLCIRRSSCIRRGANESFAKISGCGFRYQETGERSG
eukprot:TRINITY_DN4430_c0_g1_i2.p1 TRINITY_DN4430_c0_g1~~TRINITY_DN4430_c0_g1_i2.p1  ORF type:complete len:268 (-),score=56.77 TRINITY_DN4430_c0_g1_i2:99-857(-)